ncbi:hypothetical protein [Streptomyces hydrogenans]|uniref:hypothetical protein n=1 Tax=Streptomyces hydrogenans TaxID=1873719 RepID=UPI0033AA6556
MMSSPLRVMVALAVATPTAMATATFAHASPAALCSAWPAPFVGGMAVEVRGG